MIVRPNLHKKRQLHKYKVRR